MFLYTNKELFSKIFQASNKNVKVISKYLALRAWDEAYVELQGHACQETDSISGIGDIVVAPLWRSGGDRRGRRRAGFRGDRSGRNIGGQSLVYG